MKPTSVEYHIEQEFHVSWYIIVYKFLFGLTEFVLGLAITLFGHSALLWYRAASAQELIEDPHDVVVRLTENIIPNVLTHNTFLAIYLLLLGAAKIVGAIGLIYKQHWGVDVLVGLTFIMFPFQLIQLIRHPTLADFFYIIIGLLIALYLVNFQPQQWAKRIIKQAKI